MYRITKKLTTPTVKVNTSNIIKIKLTGNSFIKLQNVYLSGYPYENTTFYSPFSTSKILDLYPGFYGIQLSATQFTYSLSSGMLTFVMPSASRAGYVDVILQNDGGYGSVTQHVLSSTYNPYISGTTEYDTYEPYVRPWKDGILVINV